MYSSFLFRLIFLRGPLFHVNSIIKALFNHTVLFRKCISSFRKACTHLSPLFLNLGVISVWNCRQPQHFLSWAFSVSHFWCKSHPCPFKKDNVQLISSLNDLKGTICWSLKMGMGENLAKGIILPSAAQSGGEGSKWKGGNVTVFTWGQMENGQEGSYIP